MKRCRHCRQNVLRGTSHRCSVLNRTVESHHHHDLVDDAIDILATVAVTQAIDSLFSSSDTGSCSTDSSSSDSFSGGGGDFGGGGASGDW